MSPRGNIGRLALYANGYAVRRSIGLRKPHLVRHGKHWFCWQTGLGWVSGKSIRTAFARFKGTFLEAKT